MTRQAEAHSLSQANNVGLLIATCGNLLWSCLEGVRTRSEKML